MQKLKNHIKKAFLLALVSLVGTPLCIRAASHNNEDAKQEEKKEQIPVDTPYIQLMYVKILGQGSFGIANDVIVSCHSDFSLVVQCLRGRGVVPVNGFFFCLGGGRTVPLPAPRREDGYKLAYSVEQSMKLQRRVVPLDENETQKIDSLVWGFFRLNGKQVYTVKEEGAFLVGGDKNVVGAWLIRECPYNKHGQLRVQQTRIRAKREKSQRRPEEQKSNGQLQQLQSTYDVQRLPSSAQDFGTPQNNNNRGVLAGVGNREPLQVIGRQASQSAGFLGWVKKQGGRLAWDTPTNMAIDVAAFGLWFGFKYYMRNETAHDYIKEAEENAKNCQEVADFKEEMRTLKVKHVNLEKEQALLDSLKNKGNLRPDGKRNIEDLTGDVFIHGVRTAATPSTAGATLVKSVWDSAKPSGNGVDGFVSNLKKNWNHIHKQKLKTELLPTSDRIVRNSTWINQQQTQLEKRKTDLRQRANAWEAKIPYMDGVYEKIMGYKEKIAERGTFDSKNEAAGFRGFSGLMKGFVGYLKATWGKGKAKIREIAQDAEDTAYVLAPAAVLGAIGGGRVGAGLPFVVSGLMGIQAVKYVVKSLKTNKKLLAWAAPPNGNEEESRYRLFKRYTASFLLNLKPEDESVKYAGALLGVLTWFFITYIPVWKGKTLAAIAMDNFKVGVWAFSLYGARQIMRWLLCFWPFTNAWFFNFCYFLVVAYITWYIYFSGEDSTLNAVEQQVRQISEKLGAIKVEPAKTGSFFQPLQPFISKEAVAFFILACLLLLLLTFARTRLSTGKGKRKRKKKK